MIMYHIKDIRLFFVAVMLGSLVGKVRGDDGTDLHMTRLPLVLHDELGVRLGLSSTDLKEVVATKDIGPRVLDPINFDGDLAELKSGLILLKTVSDENRSTNCVINLDGGKVVLVSVGIMFKTGTYQEAAAFLNQLLLQERVTDPRWGIREFGGQSSLALELNIEGAMCCVSLVKRVGHGERSRFEVHVQLHSGELKKWDSDVRYPTKDGDEDGLVLLKSLVSDYVKAIEELK